MLKGDGTHFIIAPSGRGSERGRKTRQTSNWRPFSFRSCCSSAWQSSMHVWERERARGAKWGSLKVVSRGVTDLGEPAFICKSKGREKKTRLLFAETSKWYNITARFTLSVGYISFDWNKKKNNQRGGKKRESKAVKVKLKLLPQSQPAEGRQQES